MGLHLFRFGVILCGGRSFKKFFYTKKIILNIIKKSLKNILNIKKRYYFSSQNYPNQITQPNL